MRRIKTAPQPPAAQPRLGAVGLACLVFLSPVVAAAQAPTPSAADPNQTAPTARPVEPAAQPGEGAPGTAAKPPGPGTGAKVGPDAGARAQTAAQPGRGSPGTAATTDGGAPGSAGSVHAQLDALRAELQQLKRARSAGPQTRPAEGFGWTIPGTQTQLRIGGFIKLDAVMVSSSTNNKNDYRTTSFLMPTRNDPGEDWQLRLHARQSRLWFKSESPTPLGKLRTLIELDFFGSDASEKIASPYAPMMRHAYAQLGPLLVGQTWSGFVQPFALPPNLDCLGSMGTVFIRQAQLRYTQQLGGGLRASFALENPHSDLYRPQAAPAQRRWSPQDDRLPDLTLRLDHKGEYGQVSLALLGRQLRYDLDQDGVHNHDSRLGFGANLGARVQFSFGQLRALFIAGSGLGRYLSTGVAPAAWVRSQPSAGGGRVVTGIGGTIPSAGGTLSYEHYLSPRWRTAGVLSGAQIFLPKQVEGSGITESVLEASISLLYQPFKRLRAGMEYNLERRQTSLPAGQPDPDLQHRVQLAVMLRI